MNKKIAIVTGVSRLKGIGRAICLELAKRDYNIFFTYWTAYDHQMPWGLEENEPELIQKEIIELGVQCCKLELDLSLDNSPKRLFDEVTSKLGIPNVLINNATYSTDTNIDDLTSTELDNHYQVNLKGATLLIVEFVKRFDGKSSGRIVNMISGQSLGKMSNEVAYAITKGAIENLTWTLSSELASRGITINAVNPGPNDTGWMDSSLKTELLDRFPMRRLGIPRDTARLIGFLISEDAEWVTGQVIHSEGGFVR